MERIELIQYATRAYRWIGNKALPMPWQDALARIARGLAVEVRP